MSKALARRRQTPGAPLDNPAARAQMRVRAKFAETIRRTQSSFWSAFVKYRNSNDVGRAARHCARHDLVDDWVLPQLWYDAGLEVSKAIQEGRYAIYLTPTTRDVWALIPEAEPASETRADYVKKVARLAAERYDAAVSKRLATGASRIVKTPEKHFEWLVRFVIEKKSFNVIWKESPDVKSANTVRVAVIELAKIIGLTLRKLAPGRPVTRKPLRNN